MKNIAVSRSTSKGGFFSYGWAWKTALENQQCQGRRRSYSGRFSASDTPRQSLNIGYRWRLQRTGIILVIRGIRSKGVLNL